MKKLLTVLLLFAGCFILSAGPLGVRQEKTNYMVVTNNYFSCTFFPKHMFPVWFKTPDGREFPPIVRFLDRAVIGGTAYWLYTDLWAEQEVVTNTDEEFVIKCSGVYCHVEGDKVAPGDLRAVYTYTIKKNLPTIKITADITRKDKSKKIRIVFLQPAWSMKQEFDTIRRDGKDVKLMPKHSFDKAQSVTFVKDNLAIMARFNNSDPIVTARYQMLDGFSSILTFNREMGGTKLFLTGFLKVREEKLP